MRPGRRRARITVLALAGLVVFPIVPILALRWIDPPTTAFMLRHRFAREPTREGDASATRRTAIDYRWTDLDDVAPVMALAVVAAEDQLFPRHRGFDVESIEKAVSERHRRRRVRGASTISQQVAKNLFLWPGRSFVRKGLEAYLTALLETTWPKRRILEVYLNVAELGDGIYGVGAAADVYFHKQPAALTRREAALLAAALPNPKRRPADRPSAWMLERARWIEGQIDQLGGAAHLAGVLPTP
ncbi:MAG TPA: monofunctional biosynthetic peptidoglycan transglycosylase [Thermoanaerobaculia bacterium]|nr:monofunctional biosynthetic peptidoglycan transglycosylase [Thermoanaerobaculia bacterium]